MDSKSKQHELSVQEQKDIREGALIKTEACPAGSVRDSVSCSTTTGDYEILYSHVDSPNKQVLGIRCENVYAYCDGHDYIDKGSGTGSGAEDSGTEGSGAEGSGTFLGIDDNAGGDIKLL